MESISKKPSVERRWEQYYPQEAKSFEFPRANIFDVVYEQNKNRKDKVAIEYEENEITFGKFFDKVEEKTDFFQSKGVKEGDIVTVSMLMSPEFVYDWYALGRLNAVSNLIDPRTSVEGIRKYLTEAQSKLILNTSIFTPKILKAIDGMPYNVINYSLKESAVKMPLVLGLISGVMDVYSKLMSKKNLNIENYKLDEGLSSNEALPLYKQNQPLTIVHTGGTTGFPKGVLLSHDNYNAMAYQYMKSKIGFAPDDRFLLVMPPWISYGSGMLHMSMVTGMKSTIISKLDSKKMADYLIKYKPQWFAGVPAHYKIITDSDVIAKNGVPFLKAGAVGGDSMSAELYEEASNYLKENGASKGVYPGYALTEVTSAFAVKQLEDYKPGSVGIPLPGSTVGIFKYDEDNDITTDEELDYNLTGEICMRTPNQMLGYFKHDDLTELVLKKHSDGHTWVHTGDLGHIDDDGVLYVDGRIKEMITRYDGFKVYPSLIEKVINANNNVDSCKVVGIDDKNHNHGSVPKAFIVLNVNCEHSKNTLKEIESECRYCLPDYYVEGLDFEVVDSLPLTPIGKVDFNALKQREKTKVLKKHI